MFFRGEGRAGRALGVWVVVGAKAEVASADECGEETAVCYFWFSWDGTDGVVWGFGIESVQTMYACMYVCVYVGVWRKKI